MATVLMLLIGVAIVTNVADDRGLIAAIAVGALYFSGAWFIASGRNSNTSSFAARHPYLDAAWAIPIAAVFALVILPTSWPLGTVLAIGGAYVALIFFLAWRSIRLRETPRHAG